MYVDMFRYKHSFFRKEILFRKNENNPWQEVETWNFYSTGPKYDGILSNHCIYFAHLTVMNFVSLKKIIKLY